MTTEEAPVTTKKTKAKSTSKKTATAKASIEEAPVATKKTRSKSTSKKTSTKANTEKAPSTTKQTKAKSASEKISAKASEQVKAKSSSKKTTKTKATAKKDNAQTLLLLALWDSGAQTKEVNTSDLITRIKRKNERIGAYQRVFRQLMKVGAIKSSGQNNVTLTNKGSQMLLEGITSLNIAFDGRQVASKVANAYLNALLAWIRDMNSTSVAELSN